MDKELKYTPYCGRCMKMLPSDVQECDCGGTRVPLTYREGKEHSRKFDLFTPFTLEGTKFDTKAQWDAHRQKIADIHCVSPADVVLQDNSLRDRERRYEDAQHERYKKLTRRP